MIARRWWAVAFALLAATALACKGQEGAGGTSPEPDPTRTRVVAGLPSSMAAIGDSITAGYGSCFTLTNCPRNSWATGDGSLVDSHYRRILDGNPAIKGHAKNFAASGATAAGLASQATKAAATHPAYLTVMIGANDACRSTMTATSTFASQIDTALRAVKTASPQTRILMVSIPNVYRVWEVGHTSRLARSVWSLGVCPSLLANPTSTAAADVARRQAFRERIDAYDGLLAKACTRYGHLCRWDGGAVHDATFNLSQLSALDFFHPNADGQNEIAEVTFPSSFTW
ncbi:SGNH/GDSL hydrolase family protein [Rugosimonospora africana]|uniref:Lipoprotein n=1 Tax=Rugosimonospora africana TaxID=556532 RepID=A0A8J3QNQ5_9ACTN|nr:SGNH/GDSL hydrolase family protein [Rugosimonospora africana]GIH13489.1 lipoprotein [Rugosimonospora africana]